jgi:adenine-specific DNA-methyltransferase
MDALAKFRPSAHTWRPIHYLGSKLRVVDPISDLLDQVDPQRGRLCDLFAGSGTVSAAMAPQRAVTAVDVQEYSRILCSALLQPATISEVEARSFHDLALNGAFREELTWAAEALVEYEKQAMGQARHGSLDLLFDLIEFGPIVNPEHANDGSYLATAMERTRKRLKKIGCATGPKAVVLRHFGGVYFSYAQAIDLTALLEAAARCSGRTRYTMMAAVLSTTSDIVNTVGKQFAQPIKPRDKDGNLKPHLLQKIVRDRSIDAFAIFSVWLEKYIALAQTDKPHKILRDDYNNALLHNCADVSVIYADPPYTRDHYSRYYHVLETMCLRDDPQVAATHPSSKGSVGRGVYRLDRHQSAFCIKSQAPHAFARLFENTRRLQIPLLLSYSPLAGTTKPRPRAIATSDLKEIAQKFFRRVDVVSAGHVSHNKLNKTSLNSEVSHDAELFLVCS